MVRYEWHLLKTVFPAKAGMIAMDGENAIGFYGTIHAQLDELHYKFTGSPSSRGWQKESYSKTKGAENLKHSQLDTGKPLHDFRYDGFILIGERW